MIARPRVRGKLFRAATISPYFWPMGGEGSAARSAHAWIRQCLYRRIQFITECTPDTYYLADSEVHLTLVIAYMCYENHTNIS